MSIKPMHVVEFIAEFTAGEKVPFTAAEMMTDLHRGIYGED